MRRIYQLVANQRGKRRSDHAGSAAIRAANRRHRRHRDHEREQLLRNLLSHYGFDLGFIGLGIVDERKDVMILEGEESGLKSNSSNVTIIHAINPLRTVVLHTELGK